MFLTTAGLSIGTILPASAVGRSSVDAKTNGYGSLSQTSKGFLCRASNV
jgi:hypothetical protein